MEHWRGPARVTVDAGSPYRPPVEEIARANDTWPPLVLLELEALQAVLLVHLQTFKTTAK